jgi:amino acid transporter
MSRRVKDEKLGTFSLLSIGIGGMVGGGIFAVTGLTVEITRGAAPIAFVVAGVVALSFAIEAAYRRATGRRIHVRHAGPIVAGGADKRIG